MLVSKLPAFKSGSEKQKEWACVIRIDAMNAAVGQLAVAQKHLPPERYEKVVELFEQVICSHTDAKWWIDNRGERLGEIIHNEMQALLDAAQKGSKQ